jgi:hypothetical protein
MLMSLSSGTLRRLLPFAFRWRFASALVLLVFVACAGRDTGGAGTSTSTGAASGATSTGGASGATSTGGASGATGGSTSATPGAERGPCYPNSTCNLGLTCASNLCVKLGGSGGLGGGGGGFPGSGGAGGAIVATGGTAGGPSVPYKPCGVFDGGSQGGLCVPKVVLDASGNPLAPILKQDDCPLATDRCVPALKANDPKALFQKCQTTLTVFGPQYGAGACVPAYIVRDTNPAGLAILKKDTCTGADELCTPCLDPLSMPTAGVPSHFCE